MNDTEQKSTRTGSSEVTSPPNSGENIGQNQDHYNWLNEFIHAAKTPLTLIGGYASIIDEKLPKGEKFADSNFDIDAFQDLLDLNKIRFNDVGEANIRSSIISTDPLDTSKKISRVLDRNQIRELAIDTILSKSKGTSKLQQVAEVDTFLDSEISRQKILSFLTTLDTPKTVSEIKEYYGIMLSFTSGRLNQLNQIISEQQTKLQITDDFFLKGQQILQKGTHALAEFEFYFNPNSIRVLDDRTDMSLETLIHEARSKVDHRYKITDDNLDTNIHAHPIISGAFNTLIANLNPRKSTDAIFATNKIDGATIIGIADNGTYIPISAQKSQFDEVVPKKVQVASSTQDESTPQVISVSTGQNIGLSMAKRIIEAHKGKIGVISEPNPRATVFYFILPDKEQIEGVIPSQEEKALEWAINLRNRMSSTSPAQ